MAAPKGNRFWEARSTHGRDKIFKDSEVLWGACCEYFQWVEDNPLWEEKVTQYQGEPVSLPHAKMRAMTLDGLCIFLGITDDTWRNYRKDDDFFGVISQVEKIIRTQKFTGAAADLLNANIISRDLGLADKQELTGKDGAPLETNPGLNEAARRIAFALEQAAQNLDE